jgi:signal transduction histidine kinase
LLDRQGRRGTRPFDFRRPVMRRDLETERQYSFDDGLYAAGIRAHCALPLVAGGETIGILGIGSKTKNQYSEADFEFLQEVASQIALAIANVKAYAEIEALKTRLEAENVYLRRDLIANVSHDLRTPLAALHGYLETLLMKEDRLSAQQRKNYLKIAARQSEHLGTMVSELFELVQLDFKGFEIHPESMQLGELAQDVLQKFQIAAEKKTDRLEGGDSGRSALRVGGHRSDRARAREPARQRAQAHALRGRRQPGGDPKRRPGRSPGIRYRKRDSGCGAPAYL